MTTATVEHTVEELLAFDAIDCCVDVDVIWDLDDPDPSVGYRGGASISHFEVKPKTLEVYDAAGEVVNPDSTGHTAEEILAAVKEQIEEYVDSLDPEEAFEQAANDYEAAEDAYWDAKIDAARCGD